MMATVIERGFTVIELMLFLAVTGALFAALMIGVNTNVTQQRYRDSVLYYTTTLQNQYSEVLNPHNGRGDDWKCMGDGTVVQQPNGGDSRGTTPCVILGRAIEVQDHGTTIQSSAVVGYQPTQDISGSDIATLLAYHPKVSSFDQQTEALDWGTSLTQTNHQPSSASILILRSPSSGLLRVFTSDNPLPADISSLISADAETTKLVNCVRGDSGALPIQSVTVNPRIAGLDGIGVNEVDPACA